MGASMQRQVAVLAVRSGRVCLVTSSSGRRWILPKGHIEAGQTAGEAALQEAWEEAGLVGRLRKEPLGSYVGEKAGAALPVVVHVLHVTRVAKEWPECGRRLRRWVRPRTALARLDNLGLRKLLRRSLGNKAAVLPA